MFEFDQEAIEDLLHENDNFRRLYEKHGTLKQRVNEANDGRNPMDDFELEDIKKEKLMLKDHMAVMIAEYHTYQH